MSASPQTDKKYRFLQDSGHGWLEVPHSEVEASGIDVSSHSYYDPLTDLVFLEEDIDMINFLKAIGLAYTAENINFVDYLGGVSGIRALSPYRKTK